ncbi:unnamed protein product [Haemonchus placei]|uniref:Histone H4 n=1 Tax=Haemonchus placei TaxID=6290 RepID=A0A0N4WDC2_HAEPC|nr:unnamed protein product [Haemonchus placei]
MHGTGRSRKRARCPHMVRKYYWMRFTNGGIRRLELRGGVQLISEDVYELICGVVKGVIHDAVTYCEHVRRKTANEIGVVYALKRRGYTTYGFAV